MKEYQFEPIQATCPICTTTAAEILWSVNSEQAARHYVVEAAEPQRFSKLVTQIEVLWQQDSCDVVRCNHCGFCYSHPYVAGDHQFYTLAYTRSHYPSWKWEHQRSYDLLRTKIPQTADFRLLEIGAGDGAFAKGIAPALLPKAQVLCTEFSDYGRSQIDQYGITCLAADIRAINAANLERQFDAVCLFQVIEHMDQLDVLFEALNDLTQPDASLLLSVPNPGLIEFAELNGGLLDMPPNHIGRWTKACFEEMGRRWGWTVQDYAVEQNSFFAKAKLFCKYRFWRRVQQPGSFAYQISQISNPSWRKVMQLIGVGFYAVTAIPELRALNSPDLGFSQWVHLQKTSGD